MESLITKFKASKYKYYNDTKDLCFETLDEKKCIRFIEKYFKEGGKTFLIPDISWEFSNCSQGYRATHSVVAYLLGVLLFEKYKKVIMQKIKAPTEEDRIYLYILFLTFLYHDYYYYQEQNKELEPIDNLTNKIDEIVGLEGKYSPSYINDYYEYRGKIDHGIYAGYQLNRKLKSNLDDILNGEEAVMRNNLSWSKKDIKYYDLASSAIIKHNIWLANHNSVSEVQKKRVKEYESEDLNPFIISNKDIMKFEDNPLLFILFIIDTIEPVKIFNKNLNGHIRDNYNNLLSNILINVNQKSITLRYVDRFKSIGCFTFCEAKQMETWLDVTVTQKCNEDYFELSIRFNS